MCRFTTLPAEVTRQQVRQGSGNIAVEDALSPEDTLTAFRAGIALADEEIDAGATPHPRAIWDRQ